MTVGDRVLLVDQRHVLHVLDADLHETASMPIGSPRSEMTGVPIASNGVVIAAPPPPGDDEPIRLLDAHSLAPVAVRLTGWPYTSAAVIDLAFSGDGTRLTALVDRITIRSREDGWWGCPA